MKTSWQASIEILFIRNRFMDTAGEGEGGTNGERSTEIYTLPYVNQIASGKLL